MRGGKKWRRAAKGGQKQHTTSRQAHVGDQHSGFQHERAQLYCDVSVRTVRRTAGQFLVGAVSRGWAAMQFSSSGRRLLVVVAASFRPRAARPYAAFHSTTSRPCAALATSSTADCQSICFVPHLFRKHGPYHSHRPVTRRRRRPVGWPVPIATACFLLMMVGECGECERGEKK